MNNKHFMFDGYDIKEEYLKNLNLFTQFINTLNEKIFHGSATIIPYFNGKVKDDAGISAIIMKDGFHFTCHGFYVHQCVFVDCFNSPISHKNLKNELISFFHTNKYNIPKIEKKANQAWGKHIVIELKNIIEFNKCKDIINELIQEINMTPIHDIIFNYKDENNFDIIRPIAESHLSCHCLNGKIKFDIFSCKNFPTDIVLKKFPINSKCFEVTRGKFFN